MALTSTMTNNTPADKPFENEEKNIKVSFHTVTTLSEFESFRKRNTASTKKILDIVLDIKRSP